MYTGPKLHNDNLAFGYDTGYGLDQHSSTRHYKGEPATNLITAGIPGYFGSGGETLYRSNYYGLNSDSGVFQRNFVNNPALANSGTYNNNAGLYQDFTTAALSSNTEYVLVSFDFYMITPYVRHSASSTGLNGYMRIGYTDGTFTHHGWNTSLNTPNAGDDWNNNSDYIGQWRKIGLYVDLNDSKTPSSITHTYIYNDRTITGEGIFTNFIITEHATLPTAPVNYTSGTRSSTQSIIDLKRTTNIDVSNVSFDSTGQPDLDGTGDHLKTTTTHSITGDITLEAVFNEEGATAPHTTVICTDSGYRYGVKLMSYANYNRYGLWIGFGSTSHQAMISETLDNDTTYHLVSSWNQATGQVKIYLNGVLKSTQSTGQTSAVSLNEAKIVVGADYHGLANSYGLNGQVYVGKVYQKVLTATEVKQNYNAYKNRFNI